MTDTVLLTVDASATEPALLLRPWASGDAPALVGVWRDPALRRWTSTTVQDEADAARWVREQERGWASGERFGFAVVEGPAGPEGTEAVVGNVVLKGAVAGAPSAEVGYWTAAHARGRGVASRSLEAVTRWAFDAFGDSGLRRLDLLHQVDNVGSCRVAGKAGYDLDRILPASPPAFPLDGHLHTRFRPGSRAEVTA
ncbi:GNAT family N-acetyltransferase [Streptomyces sp. NPDC058757]|uniref:GNAT family N-acetyltransferase n=1 Tax=Streptomyces sp. NPDC058757 TaxID=3346626 RepID=UPI0036A18668